MAFTEQDFEAQQAQLRQLEDELSRLDAQLDAQMKAAGVSGADLAAVDTATLPPEVAKAFTQAQENVKREGEARASRCTTAATATTSAKIPGAGRRGAVRL